MAHSTCIKCGNHSFELKELKVTGSNFRLFSVQCASCGGVVGIQEYMNTSGMLLDQNKALTAIANKLGISVSLEK